ncbi:hypothetical protein L3X38_009411 [Prunus dulcis]|uniref:Uncharacterized protein n=1 Tax=Prunus dulcis TaxID=3755 RepID=A0AAD4WG21_PRUDU|nr:hypothetical protein L3X38_009411 [Prunus dulcis]
MAPKKSKALMDSAAIPDWILGQGVEENAKELQAALEQEWIDELMPRYQGRWIQNVICYATMLSRHQIELNAPLLSAALCY